MQNNLEVTEEELQDIKVKKIVQAITWSLGPDGKSSVDPERLALFLLEHVLSKPKVTISDLPKRK